MVVEKAWSARALVLVATVALFSRAAAQDNLDDLLMELNAPSRQTETRSVGAAKPARVAPDCESAAAPRTVALVVQDHSHGGSVDILALTDELTAQLASNGFRVVNPYNSVGVNQNRTSGGERMPSASAMELARKFRAQGALTATVTDFGQKMSGIAGVGAFRRFSIRMSLSLADAWTGAAVCGERIKAESPNYSERQISVNGREYVKDLIFDTAAKCAAELKRKASGWRPAPPPPPPPPPAPPKPKLPVFDKIVDGMARDMLSSVQFLRNYEEHKVSGGGRLPIAIIGATENESGRGELDMGLKVAGERFRKKLFDSKLFDVKDDKVLAGLAKRIIASGNSPTENGDLMNELKQHGSPDFFIVANLAHFSDLDGTGYYKFRMSVHSLRTGRIVWEGIETITIRKGN